MGKQITFFVSIRADISFLKMLADNDLFVICILRSLAASDAFYRGRCAKQNGRLKRCS